MFLCVLHSKVSEHLPFLCSFQKPFKEKKLKLFLITIIKITLYIIPFVCEVVIILKTSHWNLGSSCVSEINKKVYIVKIIKTIYNSIFILYKNIYITRNSSDSYNQVSIAFL